jgi:hypothetical protein
LASTVLFLRPSCAHAWFALALFMRESERHRSVHAAFERGCVRAFALLPLVHDAKTMPMKDCIIELRQKARLFGLFATVGLAASTCNDVRFLAELRHSSTSA